MYVLILKLIQNGLVPTIHSWVRTEGEDSSFPNDGYFEVKKKGSTVDGFTVDIYQVRSAWYNKNEIIVRYHNDIVYKALSSSEGDEFNGAEEKIYNLLLEVKPIEVKLKTKRISCINPYCKGCSDYVCPQRHMESD